MKNKSRKYFCQLIMFINFAAWFSGCSAARSRFCRNFNFVTKSWILEKLRKSKIFYFSGLARVVRDDEIEIKYEVLYIYINIRSWWKFVYWSIPRRRKTSVKTQCRQKPFDFSKKAMEVAVCKILLQQIWGNETWEISKKFKEAKSGS